MLVLFQMIHFPRCLPSTLSSMLKCIIFSYYHSQLQLDPHSFFCFPSRALDYRTPLRSFLPLPSKAQAVIPSLQPERPAFIILPFPLSAPLPLWELTVLTLLPSSPLFKLLSLCVFTIYCTHSNYDQS